MSLPCWFCVLVRLVIVTLTTILLCCSWFELDVTRVDDGEDAFERDGVVGRGVALVLQQTSQPFPSIVELRVNVKPYS